MAGEMSSLGLGMSAISAVGSAYASYEQGQMQKNTMEFNAAIAQKQAEVTKASAKMTEFKKRQEIAIQIGAQQSAYAASGVVSVTGSALDVMVSSLSNAYLDLQIDAYNTEVASRGLQAQAATDSMTGAMYAAKGNVGAAQVIAGGALDYAKTQMTTEKPIIDIEEQ